MSNHVSNDKSLSAHPNIILLEQIFDAFNSGDAERVASFFSEDAESYSPAGPLVCGDLFSGREAISKGVAGRFKILNDVEWVDRDYQLTADGSVFVRWTMRRTDADGRKTQTRGCEFWRFRDGKATLKDTYYKKVGD